MKNKNSLSRTRKFAYFFGCLILVSYFVVSPHKAEASFFGDIWRTIAKIIDFSDKATSPDGNSKTSISNNTATVIASVTSSDTTRVKQLSDEIFSANADPLKKQLLVNLAKERETLVKELMRKDPALFLSLAIKTSQRNLLPLDIRPYIEREATLTSKIEVIHYDDFKNPQNSRFDYFLKDTDGKTKINFYPTDPLYLVSGAVVKASGFKLGDNFVSQTNRTNFAVQETPALASTGDQKTLVFLLDYTNSGAHPFTKEKAYDLVFNDQFQKFYKEQSYNQVSFSGDVVDWYKLNRDGNGCGGATEDELGQIIEDRGINLSGYKRLLLMSNTGDAFGFSQVGLSDHKINGISYNLSMACVATGYFDKYSSWGEQPFDWKNFDYITSHEIGHSLGVWHANGWDCGDKSLGDNCTHREYGNYFDTMGTISRALHFNAFYKEILGWIKPSQILEINKSGTYSINTLEKDSAIKFAKVSNYAQSDKPYYLEYRKAFGFDSKLKEVEISSNQNGLFINNAVKYKGENMSRLIDASPTADSWLDDTLKATLNSNATFADPDNGITIDRVSNPTDNSIDFRVTYNKPSDVDLTLDKISDGDGTVKLYAWRDAFNDYGEMVDSDFTDEETKTLRNDWHYKLVAISDSSSLGFGGWIGCDSQTQGNSWTDADGVVHYSKPSSGENACFVELSDESKQIEVDFTEASEISASPNPVGSGKSATLTWTVESGPGDCYLYSPADNLKTIKSSAFYLDTNSASRFYHGPGYYATVGRNSSGVTANLTAPTDYILTCDIETLNNTVSYNLKVGIASSGASSSSSSFSYGDSGVDTVFNYTGGAQQYLVPSGVTNVNIKASGAQGQGLGGESSAIVAVTSGETLYVYAGGQPSGRMGGWNGGGNGGATSWGAYGNGGGGASDVRQGGTTLAKRIIVAGGGGGRGSNDAGGSRMGGNGGITGASGGSGQNDPPVSGGGGGGTQTSGGNGGTAGGGGGGATGNAGATGNGGTGAIGPSGASGGGGGGGGYFGGGGGGNNYQSAGGGGGGSSYVTGARTSMTGGVRSGNGQVVITPFLKSSSSSSLSSANHTAITGLTTNITSTSATLNGAVNPKGESVYYKFFYRKESESSKSDQKTSYIFAGSGSSDISVSAQISGLSPGTKYVYRLYAYSYTTSKAVNGELKSFTTPSSSSSSVSYGIAETRPYFTTGQEANDIVGVKYKFKIANNNGQNMKILFGGSRLSGTGADTYYLERNIYNSKVSYSDPVCVGGWEKLNVMTIGQSTLRIAVPDYIKKGKTGLKTGNASYFPRITYGIDNVADVTKTDVISQANLNGQEGTIETLRGDIISDKSGWKCNNQSLDGDVYRQWNIKTTIGASTYQTSIALPENGAKYLTPYELINFRTEFFQNAGLFKIYLWDFQFKRESKTNWEPLTKWKVSDYDGNTANYGIRKTTYNGNNAIEISNDNSLKFFAKNETFELFQTSSSASSISSIASPSSSSSQSSASVEPVAFYKFDEGSGLIASDASGKGNNGSIIGTTRTTGKIGGGLYLDGIDDYIDIGNLANLQPGKISLSAWFKTDSSGGMIVRKRLYGYGLEMLSSGKVSFWIYNSAAAKFSAISPNVYNDGQWHNAVGIYDGSAVKLYIDGSQVASASAGHIHYGAGGIAIGRDGDYNISYFKGMLDEVKIYNRALNGQEALAIYNKEGGSSSSATSSSSSSATTTSPSITVISPNGGEIWEEGKEYVIKWKTSNLTLGSRIYILLNRTGGSNKTLRQNILPEDGVYEYLWKVETTSGWGFGYNQKPFILARLFDIKAVNAEVGYSIGVGSYNERGENVYDKSDNTFYIIGGSSSSSSSSSVANGLSRGLIAQYRFDDGSANDSYGNNNGSIFGAVSSGGKAGGALFFDGNDYVQIPGLLNNPVNITISAWANLTSADTNGAEIISLGNHVGLRLQDPAGSFGVSAFYRYANGWRTVRYGYGANYAGTGWHHFVYVVNDTANSQKLYVDGTLASTTSYKDSIQWTGQGADTFIGKHGSGSNANYDLNGSIDEVKIYNRALTAEEVSQLYSLPGINCDTSGSCALGYRTNWLNQIGAVLESIGQTIKQLFTIKK